MNYRPDIDGLRALAIIFILLYHGGMSLIPSGFIGVDIFFVISGFLITSIIHQALLDDTFSFSQFYNRRIWRLQPAFLLVILVATILAFLFFLPPDLIIYAKSASKSTFFNANNYFNKITSSYFAPISQQLPLLHFWSLALEWQIYLILPLIIFALYRTLKHHLIWGLMGLLFLSFYFSWQSALAHPEHTYYLLISRFYEFLMGACIAVLLPKLPRLTRFPAELLSISALTALVWIAGQSNILQGYPNHYALLVCCLTVCLIWLGACGSKQTLTGRVLSSKSVVFIGLLSYSLYLWHWVIFAVVRYQNIPETIMVKTLMFTFTFVFAYCSWRYVEKPLRRGSSRNVYQTLAFVVCVPIIFTFALSHWVVIHHGLPQRFNQELVDVEQKLETYAYKIRPTCISDKAVDIAPQCRLGAPNSNKTALMIGDSFANHYWGFMDVLGKRAKVSILAHSTSSCLTLPGIYLYDWWHFKDKVYAACHQQTKRYYNLIRKNHFNYVILGQIWPNYYSAKVIHRMGDERSLTPGKKRIAAALDRALNIIVQAGSRPIILDTTAIMEKNFHECFYRHIKQRQPYDSRQCQFNLRLGEGDIWMIRLFQKMQAKYPQLVIIDPKQVQCELGICKADLDGVPVYRDVGHITDYASYHLGTSYALQHANPLTSG
ncbi:MAG: acyltransferase [Legionella sp. 40-6]|nr:MAG: acyltransferase [Legionella sp. 40-6]